MAKPKKLPKPIEAPALAVRQSATVKVYGMLLEGHSKGEVIEECGRLFPSESAEILVVDAMELFALFSQEPRESIKGWCLEATRDLYRKMNDSGDFSGALACIKQIQSLALGKEPPFGALPLEKFVKLAP